MSKPKNNQNRGGCSCPEPFNYYYSSMSKINVMKCFSETNIMQIHSFQKYFLANHMPDFTLKLASLIYYFICFNLVSTCIFSSGNLIRKIFDKTQEKAVANFLSVILKTTKFNDHHTPCSWEICFNQSEFLKFSDLSRNYIISIWNFCSCY